MTQQSCASINPNANSYSGYHRYKDFKNKPYGSFEVFWDDADNAGNGPRNFDSNNEPVKSGWYWWSCFPGCLPDGEAQGPFNTSAEAMDAALEGHN